VDLCRSSRFRAAQAIYDPGMISYDRRALTRLPAADLTATIWLGYRAGRIKAAAIEFNRYGMAVRTSQPLPAHGSVELTLECGGTVIHGVVAAIHNCGVLAEGGYRCGLQFRTDAPTQFDRDHIRRALANIEEMLTRNEVTSTQTAQLTVT